ncbi:hypothetical protein ANCCEY_13844 [Ancylostoma ceylanicum]|uniref:Uncharacterized protein n=1 Tax=Ancylostoma ceylanicum TaxID=53326 RepID=A0A0D6L6L2_9BILA|nr:hypothetical protein ANCCEY_13844 [Ancylostoma ceylanicum]
MTTRQRLGGGEFKDEEEPFLLQRKFVEKRLVAEVIKGSRVM